MRSHRRQSWGLGGVTTPDFWLGVVARSQGDCEGGREALLYVIMYRKYVRKWWLSNEI